MFIHLRKNTSQLRWEVVDSKEDSLTTIQSLPLSIPSLISLPVMSNSQNITYSSSDAHSNSTNQVPTAAEKSGNTQIPTPSSQLPATCSLHNTAINKPFVMTPNVQSW